MKINWSTRQLERQINSFYYERLLSTQEENKDEVRNEIKKLEPERNINDMVAISVLRTSEAPPGVFVREE